MISVIKVLKITASFLPECTVHNTQMLISYLYRWL